MRLQIAATALILPFALARSSKSSSAQQIQVYLHPSPTSPHKSVPTLSADQAKAVLNHHLGEHIGDFDEIPADEGMWGHLVGIWGGSGREVDGARVVIVDGGASSQAVLPTNIRHEPSFYLEDNDDSDSLFAPYVQRAQSFFSDILAQMPDYVKDFVDGLEMTGTKAAATLHQELSALIALSEKELIPFLANIRTSTWEAVRISGLVNVKEGSSEWEEGTKSVQAGLQAMTQPDSPPLMLVIMPNQATFHAKRSFIEETSFNDTTPICYSSESKCSDSTSCNDRGSCAMLGKTGSKECWGCKCSSGYAGSECQKADYTVPFVIIVFSTLFLMALVMGSVALLWTVGETKLPSTLTLAVGQAKRD